MSNFDFDSQITQKHELESKIINRHSFSSTIVNSHFFESVVSGFLLSATWFAKFVSDTRINISSVSASAKTSTRAFAEFTTNTGMVINRLLVSIGLRPRAEFISATTISIVMKIAQKMGTPTFSSPTSFVIKLTDLIRINSVDKFLTNTNFQATATANKYYLVSDWDASLLSILDTMTLSEIDSQIV